MNYDTRESSSSTPGPNAPLSDACGNSTQPDPSVDGSVKAWTKAGFAREKILMGVCKIRTSLVKQGALQGLPSSSPFANFTASGGFSRHWDLCFPPLTLYRRPLINL